MSLFASLDCSNTGSNCLHGPHQSAQKSRRTISLSVMVLSRVSLVTVTVGMEPPQWCRLSSFGRSIQHAAPRSCSPETLSLTSERGAGAVPAPRQPLKVKPPAGSLGSDRRLKMMQGDGDQLAVY